MMSSVSVQLSELTNDAIQTNLFDDTASKVDLYKAIDDVKNKYGKSKLKRASSN